MVEKKDGKKGKKKDGKGGKKVVKGEKKEAKIEEKIEIHSFDIIVLAKVGKAAMQWMHLESDSEKNRFVQSIVEQRARDGIPTTDGEVRERLNQAFFTPTFQYVMFLFLFVGFAIKVPVFPFHTWLPDAHVEAPTPISMILPDIFPNLAGYALPTIPSPPR